jgi:hypothetical protein
LLTHKPITVETWQGFREANPTLGRVDWPSKNSSAGESFTEEKQLSNSSPTLILNKVALITVFLFIFDFYGVCVFVCLQP